MTAFEFRSQCDMNVKHTSRPARVLPFLPGLASAAADFGYDKVPILIFI